MKTIILHGQLGKLFGRRHRLDVATAAEAVRALCANFSGFEKHMLEAKCMGYRVKLHDTPVHDTKELHHPVGGSTITFTPVVSGAGRGLGQILLGAALIAASFLVPGLSAVALGGSTTLATIAFNVGFSLALGGVAQLLAPAPKTRGPNERPENMPSDIFNGPVNTTAQSHPVPVGYGRLIVGGAVLSGGLTTEEIPV